MTDRVVWSDWSAVLWDLDGVITATAEVHQRAWAELFSEWDFTTDDYLTHVDGRPRYDGVRAFLASREVHLPEGNLDDDPTEVTVCGFGNRKNLIFNDLIETEGVRAYPGTLDVMDLCSTLGLAQAVVSSSRNARTVLAAAGLGARCEVVVDGLTAAQADLAGKPGPDMYLYAAHQVQVPIAQCVVVEDAVSGVAAGVAAGAGLVLGVDRENRPQELWAAGADLVVDDLARTLEH